MLLKGKALPSPFYSMISKFQILGLGMGLSFILGLFNSLMPMLVGYDGIRWISLLAVAFALGSATILNIMPFSIKNAPPIFLVPLLGTVVLFWESLTSNGLVFLAYEVLYWVAPALLGVHLGLLHKKSNIISFSQSLAVMSVVSVTLYVLTIIMGLLFWYNEVSGKVTDYLPFGFYNIRLWSHIATWLIPLACSIVFIALENRFSSLRKYIPFLYFVFGCWFMVLLGSGARGSLVAQIASFIVLAFLYRHRFFVVGRFWLISFAAGCFLYGIFIVVVPWLIFENVEIATPLRSGASGRLTLWHYAFALSVQDFPLGVGPLGYILNTPEDALGSPHSFYLMWAAEYGWLFLLIFIFGLGTFSWRGWMQPRHVAVEDHAFPYQIAVQWSVLAAFIHAGVSGIFTSSISQLVGFPILVAYFAHMASHYRVGRVDNHTFRKIFIASNGAMLGLVLVIVPPMYSWWQSAQANQAEYIEVHQRPLAPRFWLHGRFVQENPD